MKKLFFTLTLLLALTLGASAQGGMFGYGRIGETYTDWGPSYWNATQDWTRTVGGSLILPTSHGSGTDQNGVPVGSGVLLLTALGAAYALKKRKRN